MTGRVVALALFEGRLLRRRLRSWLVSLAALVASLPAFVELTVQQVQRTGHSAAASLVGPEHSVLLPAWIAGLLSGLCAAVLAFDARWSHESSHFRPVLDASAARPHELALARLGALLPFASLPVLGLAALHAAMTLAQGRRLVASTLLVGPGLLGMSSVVAHAAVAVAAATLLRSRSAALLVPVGVVAARAAAPFGLPDAWAQALGAAWLELPVRSDLTGWTWPTGSPAALGALGLSAVAALTLAACDGKAPPSSRRDALRRRVVAAAALAAWAAMVAASGLARRAELAACRQAVAAERAARDRAGFACTHRGVEVWLATSRPPLRGHAELRLRNETRVPLTTVRLRLNPGLSASRLGVDGVPAAFSRTASVLEARLPAPVEPGESITLALDYSGSVTPWACDPDLLLELAELPPVRRAHRRLAGTRPALLARRIAVLPMDAGWVPSPTFTAGLRYPEGPPWSHAPGRLIVHVPEGWTASSVGARSFSDGAFAFETTEPVPGLGLVAGQHEEREGVVAGLRVRLLSWPLHGARVAWAAEAVGPLAELAESFLDRARQRAGVTYPHPVLTLAEVPQPFAGRSGSWEGTERLAQPGLVLLREAWFFRASFEPALERARRRSEGARRDGAATPGDDELRGFDVARAKAGVLREYSRRDPFGGDLERLAFRSFWDFRVTPEGPERLITGPVLADFLFELASGRRPVAGTTAFDAIARPLPGAVGWVRKQRVRAIASDPDEALSLVEQVPLSRLGPCEAGRHFAGVAELKGRRPLWALNEVLGRDSHGFAHAVERLLRQRGGRSVRLEDLAAACLAEAEPRWRDPLRRVFDGWMSDTALPGFVVHGVRAAPLAGSGGWQVLAHVENAGDALGVGRLVVADSGDRWVQEPFFLEAGERAEIGLLATSQPERWAVPSLLPSRNRNPAGGTMTLSERPFAGAPFSGTREAPPLRPAGRPEVIVDNLDPGFAIVRHDGTVTGHVTPRALPCGVAQAAGPEPLPRFDPVLRGGFSARRDRWHRWRPRGRHRLAAHGTFDASVVLKAGGEGRQPATWTAALPHAGVWRVQTWLGLAGSRYFDRRTRLPREYVYEIAHAGGTAVVRLDLAGTVRGWNGLGRFRFDGRASVTLRDLGDGLVIADAVRFTTTGGED